MDASQALKGVVVWGIGYDHIDMNAASDRGIYVANTRGSNAESVAEQTFAFILSLSRRLLQANHFVRGGMWITREESGLPNGLIGNDLFRKTIGIIGLGAIGSRVFRIARGFSMHTLACDPYMSIERAKEIGAELVDLEMLLRTADFVTLHTVLTEKTKGMISSKQLDLMKPTAFLINTSRGPVVDEEALIKALEEGKIAGAGLDVFNKEPIDPNNPLLKFDNVVVTPHYAGNSMEALNATAMMVSEETVRILCDQVPKNIVT